MNSRHQTFVQEMLQHGDKIKAYSAAYPKAKQSSLKTLANRLLQHPEVQSAVGAGREQVRQQAEAKAVDRMTEELLTVYEMKLMLTRTARGQLESEKTFCTRHGFKTTDVKPTIAQRLRAADMFARMEGWYVKKSAKKEKEKQEEAEPQDIELYMEGLPWDEYFEKWGGTIDAYFEPEQTSRCQPDDNNSTAHFLSCQKYRDEKKDKERDEKMTPELQVEENRAIAEWKRRPVDDSLYVPEKKVIKDLWDKYLETKDDEILKEYKAVQKLAGLRFLKHRHRYEAEREAGWEFHPFNNAVIRKASHYYPVVAPSPHVIANAVKQSHENMGSVLSEDHNNNQSHFTSNNPQDVRLLRPHLPSQMLPRNDHTERQHLTTNQDHEVKSDNPARAGTTNQDHEVKSDNPARAGTNNPGNLLNPANRGSDYTGYQNVHDVIRDHWNAYVSKPIHEAHRARLLYETIFKLARYRTASPEIKAKVQEEAGWEYHPDNNLMVRKKRAA